MSPEPEQSEKLEKPEEFGGSRGLVIAIDGPAGSGKSSVAREVSERLGATNLNTGGLYRAVALVALREDVEVIEAAGETGARDVSRLVGCASRLGLDGSGVFADGKRVPDEDLRTPEVSAAASSVSVYPEVREVLNGVQRQAASEAAQEAPGGVVVEGRDIGTVVLPDADLKVFLSASAEERARRRAVQNGREAEIERITQAMETRDRRDSERETSPLRPAGDAAVIDTTALSLQETVGRILDLAAGARRREEQEARELE